VKYLKIPAGRSVCKLTSGIGSEKFLAVNKSDICVNNVKYMKGLFDLTASFVSSFLPMLFYDDIPQNKSDVDILLTGVRC
jgi:hypothetical protein